MQKIKTSLWFDGNAEEAANFYVGIFPNSRIVNKSYYGEGASFPKGTVLEVTFELQGQQYLGLNGGPEFKFTEAISLQVDCDTQEELDQYWEKLSADGGKPSQCGWLKDKYGLSWQVTPSQLSRWMTGDSKQVQRVFDAIMKMHKLDTATLERAYNGE